MLDLMPATTTLTELVGRIADAQLDDPTPCSKMRLAGLLGHIDGLTLAFTAAARKAPPPGGSRPPSPEAAQLADGWRTRMPQRLDELARAWSEEASWSGATEVGGVSLDGTSAGLFAANELIVHGWDLASAAGLPFAADPGLVAATHDFIGGLVAQNPAGAPGLFAAPVAVPDSAPVLNRLIGLTGRDPGWGSAE